MSEKAGGDDGGAYLARPALVQSFLPSWRLNLRDFRFLIGLGEAAAIAGSALLSRHMVAPPKTYLAERHVFAFGLLVALLAALLRRVARGSVENPFCAPRRATSWSAVAAMVGVLLGGMVWWLAFVSLAPNLADAPAGLLVRWIPLWAAMAAAASFAIRHGSVFLAVHFNLHQRIVVIGDKPLRKALVDAVRQAPGFLWRAEAAFDWAGIETATTLRKRFSQGQIDLVVLVFEAGLLDRRVLEVCRMLEDLPAPICIAVDCAEVARLPSAAPRLSSFALFGMVGDPQAGLGGVSKRLCDLFIGSVALVALSPLMLAIALVIHLESPGPVLFRQKRFGIGSRSINVMKFRTMRSELCDLSGAKRTTARDPRVTRVGRVLRRTSFDELPQLLNVIRGEMSLVGPRPHPLQMAVGDRLYLDAVAHYRARHVVKPGITGWAQVNGSRGAVDTIAKAERRVALDLWYLNNWSLCLDLLILLRTVLGGFASFNAD